MKKLQILITHYKEDYKVGKGLLDSIAMQTNIPIRDFSVIIVNDGNDVIIPQEFLDSYKFKIDYYVMEHGGVSKARNYALSKATAEYVMFCDYDDEFFLDFAFFWIFREVKKKPDVFNSVFVEECGEGHLEHKHDNTFIHGKAFKRKFLLREDIKFDEELQYHEDGYFVLLAQCCADVIRYFEYPFYLWKEREGSVARQSDYIQKSWSTYLLAKRKVIAELNKRGYEEISQYVVNSLLIEARERNLNKHNLLETAKFYREFKDLYEGLDDQRRKELEENMSALYRHKITTDATFYEKMLELI